jgi:hypothetical protein
METFMRGVPGETFDAKGKIATQWVRFCTDKYMGFPTSAAKFPAGQQRGSRGTA